MTVKINEPHLHNISPEMQFINVKCSVRGKLEQNTYIRFT